MNLNTLAGCARRIYYGPDRREPPAVGAITNSCQYVFSYFKHYNFWIIVVPTTLRKFKENECVSHVFDRNNKRKKVFFLVAGRQKRTTLSNRFIDVRLMDAVLLGEIKKRPSILRRN